MARGRIEVRRQYAAASRRREMADTPAMSRAEAQKEIDRMIAEDRDLGVKLTDPRSPERARWLELNNLAAGQAPPAPAAASSDPKAAAAAKIKELQNDRDWYRRFSDPRAEGHSQAKADWASAVEALAGGEAA
jgi:hypothetical protein